MNGYAIICLVCLIAGGVGALSILLLQIRDAYRLRNILKDYKEPVYKVLCDVWAAKNTYHVVNEETGEIKKTFNDMTAAVEYAQRLNTYGEKK